MPQSSFVSTRFRLACALTLATALAGPGSARPSAQAQRRPARRRSTPTTPRRSRRRPPIRASSPSWSTTCRRPTRCRRRSSSSATSPASPGKLTYHKDIVRYLEALDKASDRVTMLKIGKTEEGRDMVALAIADEATIKQPRQVQADHRAADRSAQDDRRAGAAADRHRQADLLRHQQHALAGDRQPRDADGARLPARGRRDAVHSDHPQQRHHRDHAGDRSRRPREAGRQLPRAGRRASRRRRWSTGASTCSTTTTATAWASVLRLTQVMLKTFLDWHPDRLARPARGGHASLHVDRHGPVQRGRRSDPGQRVVAARAERHHGDDQARRARRVDLRLLRRLGPELHVLHRRHAQLDRPVLRGPELRRRRQPSAARARRAASGSGRTRRCRTSRGARATTSTSRRARSCSR